MAGFTRVNGAAAPIEAVGRNLYFKNFAKGSAMSQADLEALVQSVGQTSSITVIGSFTAGTSTSVNLVIEGADVTSYGAYTVTNVSGFTA